MRIAILGARGVPARYGGFDTVATELAPRLAARGGDVTVYCQPRYSLPERPAAFNGAKLVYLPAIQKRALENVSHEIFSLLHALRSRFDIIYVLGMRATAVYALAAPTRATVFFNTDGHDWRRRKWGPRARRYLEWSEGVGARLRPTGLIADSRAIAEYFTERYGATPTFIPYGAPRVDPPDDRLVLERGLEPDGYFLAVCRFEPENNVDKMVAAYARAASTRKLVIVGDTNYRSGYVDEIRRSAPPGVVFIGWLFEPEALNALFGHSTAYLHGHEVGGTNPSLLHAMAARCNIFANDVVYNREVLGDAGRYWDSVDSLAGLLRAVDAEPPPRISDLGEAAHARVRRHYDWDAVADDYMTLFADVLARR